MFMSVLLGLKSLPDIAPFTVLISSAPSFFVAWVPVRIASVVLPSKTFGAIDDYMWGVYQKFVLFFFEKLSPVEVLLYGDVEEVLEDRKSVLYISNHQSTFDWIVADMIAVRQGSLGNMRYVLKDGLRFLPLYGYYFFQHDCLYVRRGRKFNSETMIKYLLEIPKRRSKTFLVLFPEGTRFNPENTSMIASSQDHAKKAGMTPLENLLTPRFKAFQLSLSTLRPYFDAVYDVTILYSQTRVMDHVLGVRRLPAPTMNEYMHGKKQKLHIIIRRINVQDIPADEQGIEDWLYSLFEQKDVIIGKYYKHGTLPCSPHAAPLSWMEVIPAALVLIGLNMALWGTEIGRKVYLASAVGGTLVTAAWMTICKAV